MISEAEENENGFIDYHEFVPLAVDMIQAFRARSRAKSVVAGLESSVEDEVLSTLAAEELENTTKICMEKFREADPRHSNVLRIQELRRCLREAYVGLTNTEINLISQALPRDLLGRVCYEEFRKILYDVRFTVMKNTIVEAQGSDVQKYLMDLCKEDERVRLSATGEDGTTTGWIPLRNLVNLMVNSPRLSLSRLQVMVLVSEAAIQDGLVNYWHFVPIAAKTIEMMFDPKALRRRAELLEKTEMSASSLLGMTPESVQRRLMSLFKSYDADKSGDLNPTEFRACLESLDLQLTAGEIMALMATADVNHDGHVDFTEFCEFCTTNLLHLEREKHIRALQKESRGSTSDILKRVHNNTNITDSAYELENKLKRIFSAADIDKNGLLSPLEVHNVIRSLELELTDYQVAVLLSEVEMNEEGLMAYQPFIPICADLIQVYFMYIL